MTRNSLSTSGSGSGSARTASRYWSATAARLTSVMASRRRSIRVSSRSSGPWKPGSSSAVGSAKLDRSGRAGRDRRAGGGLHLAQVSLEGFDPTVRLGTVDQVDEGAGDDHPVGQADQRPDVLRARDAEADHQ